LQAPPFGLQLSSPPSTSSAALPSLSLPRLLPEQPRPGLRALASPLAGSADALALAQFAAKAAERNELVAVVCAEALAVQRLAAEIPWFAPGLRVSVLPDWETLPYDHFSPHQDLVSERLATLYHASRGECDVLLVAATSVPHVFVEWLSGPRNLFLILLRLAQFFGYRPAVLSKMNENLTRLRRHDEPVLRHDRFVEEMQVL